MKKYALVTGAFGGMGMKCTEMLINNGFHVFAMDRNIGEASEKLTPIQADVTNSESIAAAFDKVKSVADTLDAVIHFAGIYVMDSLVEIDEKRFRSAFDINVTGVYLVNKTFMPLMKSGSRIIITTSELAPLSPLPFTGLYAVTKSALDKYAYSLRMELQLLGISVSVIRAGAVSTNMIDSSTSQLDAFCENTGLYKCNSARFKKIVNGVESRKIPPEKLAKKALYILKKRRPKFAYAINRNPLLLMLDAAPSRFRFFIIRKILE